MSNKMSLMPSISIPRSRFKQTFNHSLDMFHGDIVPVDCFEVVPGDEFSYELASLIRMSTPIVPVMGNIKAFVHAFFVPMRLIWDDTEKFYGDPTNHDKISSITPVNPASVTIPSLTSSNVNLNSGLFAYSVQDYLGKQDLKAINTQITSVDSDPSAWSKWVTALHLSVLKERGYLLIWNDHFRPSLLVNPVLIQKGGSNSSNCYGSVNGSPLMYPFKPLKGFKQYDYYTASTLSPQYGSSVTLPLGSTADIFLNDVNLASSEVYGLFAATSSSLETYPRNLSTTGFRLNYPSNPGATSGNAKMYVDLATATAASINDIRYAFQLQKYFERSNYGNTFFQQLNAHYGITNPDSRLQRAERLGSHEFYINISQVVSTADTEASGNGQPIGQTGAVSVTGDKCHLFTKSFSEPGYVYVLITTKYDRSYGSGWLREDMKANRFEFYTPEFANLGDQATKLLELQTIYQGGYVKDTDILGYNEHWAEYRYRKDLVSGTLRPGSNFDIWTLADNFDGSAKQKVVLGQTFLEEDRTSLARLLASGNNGPDYICDFHANILTTRELPLYSIPGLIDHFGAL